MIDLKNKYIKYSEDITEEIFNKIIEEAKKQGMSPITYSGWTCTFYDFKIEGYLLIDSRGYPNNIKVDNNSQSSTQIFPSDIIDIPIYSSKVIFKKDDIVVSLNTFSDYREEGQLFKLKNITEYNDTQNLIYKPGTSTDSKNFRLATSDEINAYEKGCRNIKDISKYKPEEKEPFTKELYKKDLILNEIYYYPAIRSFIRFKGVDVNTFSLQKTNCNKKGNWNYNSGKLEIPSQEDINWYIACEKAESFIPKEEFLKSLENKPMNKLFDKNVSIIPISKEEVKRIKEFLESKGYKDDNTVMYWQESRKHLNIYTNKTFGCYSNSYSIITLKDLGLDIEISNNKEKELLEEAKRRYTIPGIEVLSAYRGDRIEFYSIGKYAKDVEGSKDVIWNVSKNGNEIGFLHCDGKWAEIASVPNNEESTSNKMIDIMNNEIPEYLEWIDIRGSGGTGSMCTNSQFNKGKIFKTSISYPPFIHNNWKEHLKVYSYNYKRSTKEAFDLQNNTLINPKFKIGDRVKICSKEQDKNGWGYLAHGSTKCSKIDGVQGATGKVIEVINKFGRNYYTVDFYSFSYICEDCLSLVVENPVRGNYEPQEDNSKAAKWSIGGYAQILSNCISSNNNWKTGDIYQITEETSNNVYLKLPNGEYAFRKDTEVQWLGMEKPYQYDVQQKQKLEQGEIKLSDYIMGIDPVKPVEYVFKAGDKVNIPKTKQGYSWNIEEDITLNNYDYNYFIVRVNAGDRNIGLKRADDIFFNLNSFHKNDLTLYQEGYNTSSLGLMTPLIIKNNSKKQSLSLEHQNPVIVKQNKNKKSKLIIVN